MQVLVFLLASLSCQINGRRVQQAMDRVQDTLSNDVESRVPSNRSSPAEMDQLELTEPHDQEKSSSALSSLMFAMNPTAPRSARLPLSRAAGQHSIATQAPTHSTNAERREVIMSGASGDEVAPINRDPLGHSSIMETALGDGTVSTPRAHVEQSPKKGENILEKWTKKKGLLDTRVLAPVVGALAMLGLGAQTASAQGLVDGVTAASSNSGLVQSFLLIFASEIGDKTFFIAGLLAAKYSRLISLAGSLGALAAMTVISVVIGRVFHALPPGLSGGLPLDDYAAVLAFAYFGAKTLYDAYKLPEGDSSGIEEEKKEAEEAVQEATGTDDKNSKLAAILSTFGLVFAAEVGDRSFFTTIALSAALNPFAVAVGAIAGHALATGVAVAGGALMSNYLSEKTIGYIGGSLFLVFAVTTALGVF